ncbi:MAG: hypothetical protein AAFY03_00820 [Pseudomonadota bacterium]
MSDQQNLPADRLTMDQQIALLKGETIEHVYTRRRVILTSMFGVVVMYATFTVIWLMKDDGTPYAHIWIPFALAMLAGLAAFFVRKWRTGLWPGDQLAPLVVTQSAVLAPDGTRLPFEEIASVTRTRTGVAIETEATWKSVKVNWMHEPAEAFNLLTGKLARARGGGL